MPTSIPEEELIEAVQSLASRLGRPPTRSEMDAEGEYSATPYYRQFGSWTAALEAAGLEPQYRQQIPDAELLAAIQELATDIGHPPRQQEMAEHGPFAPSTYRRRFGSWRHALEEAGIDGAEARAAAEISRADLLTALYQLTRTLGRPPTQTDMAEDGPYSVDVYHDRFGSWTAALEEADLTLTD